MLNRTASSVFHLGRAVERPDLVARLLDVHLLRLDGASGARERIVCRSLRGVLGAAPGNAEALTVPATLDTLAVDRHEDASIAASIAIARDHARRAREVVSTELWDCLDTSRSRMPRKVGGDRAHEFLGWARERSALAVGIVTSDATRHEVWEWFELGRALERLRVTGRVLGSDLLDPTAAASWALVLRAVGAAEAFHRADHGPVRPAEAAAFLLLDDRCPRAVRFVVDRAIACLGVVLPDPGSVEVDALAGVRDELAAVPTAGALEALAGVTEHVVTAVDRVSAALDARVFEAVSADA